MNKLTSAQDAIKQAIEGGYKGDEHFLLNLPEYAKAQIWIDPLFWQALGKARKWNQWICENGLHSYIGKMRYSPYRERKHGYTEAFYYLKKEFDNIPTIALNPKNPLITRMGCRAGECGEYNFPVFIATWYFHAKQWFKVCIAGLDEQKFWESLP